MFTSVRSAFKDSFYIYKQSVSCVLKLNRPRQLCAAFQNFQIRHYSRANKRSLEKRVYNVIPKPRNIGSEKERKEYDSLFPIIVQDSIDPYKSIPEAYAYYKNVLNQNVPNHQQAPGPATPAAFQAFASPADRTPENIFLANVLGWCVDMAICYLQMIDDMLDESDIRRGLPCWYKNEDVGMRAVNDSVFVENCVYVILQKYFSKNKQFYVTAMELFHQLTLDTVMAQTLDGIALTHRTNLQEFTLDRYKMIVKYASTLPTYYLPILLGMKFAGKDNPALNKEVFSILHEMGYYYRIQNDMLDVYGDPLVSGKLGSDIRNGKCNWLICRALEKVNTEQRAALKRHFGKEDAESVKIVKNIYDDLLLLEEYLEFEDKSFDSLNRRIKGMPKDFPHEYFLRVIGSVYGRDVSL